MAEAVLVTGGAKRIGREICLRLAKDGFSVFVHYRNSESESLELVNQIRSMGADAESVRCDLSQSEAHSDLFSQCAEKLGPITHLVNNASLFEHDDISTISEDTWDSHMVVNARVQTMLIKSLAQGIPEGKTGSVVNILDQKIDSPNPDHISYTASRFTMWGMTKTLARALAPRIRVNAVAPGHTIASSEQTPAGFRLAQSQSPLGFGPSPLDVAEAVSFLISARTVTGQTIFVDAGERFLNRHRDVLFETED